MKNEVKERVQTNMYDKILKENMEASLESIIKHAIGLHITNSEEIPDDIQHTKEREPDELKKVTDQDNNIYILHLELQSTNEGDMIYRMAEYRVMLQRKYRLPVKQYVLYIGKAKLSMSTSIEEEDFMFRYKIFSLQDVDYKIYLQKGTPEERLLAILSNFGEDSDEEAFVNVFEAIKAVVDGELSAGKYIKQLIILSQLRDLDLKPEKIMSLSSFTFKIEKDPFYRTGVYYGKAEGIVEGIAEGKAEGKKETAAEMKKRGMDLTVIAEVTKLPLEEIQTL